MVAEGISFLVDALRHAGQAMGVGAMSIDGHAIALRELGIRHRVVRMMMRREDELDVGARDRDALDDRLDLRRIDDRGVVRLATDHEIGVVVGERRDAFDSKTHGGRS